MTKSLKYEKVGFPLFAIKYTNGKGSILSIINIDMLHMLNSTDSRIVLIKHKKMK